MTYNNLKQTNSLKISQCAIFRIEISDFRDVKRNIIKKNIIVQRFSEILIRKYYLINFRNRT